MMQILVLCRNRDQAKFIQSGLAYENIGSQYCEIPQNQNLPIKHLSSDAFLIVSKNVDESLLLIEDIRRYKKSSPIVLMIEEASEYFDVRARKAGVNLVFTRPFPFSDIALQIKYLVYSTRTSLHNKILQIGSLRLDISQHTLFKNGKSVFLRNKEFSLLEFLMINKNRVLTRVEIFENVWDRNGEVVTNTVDVHISSLRKKIDATPNKGFIKTITCVGYFFDAGKM